MVPFCCYSSFTYREYDYLNNARQVPKLPDWAILDVSQPPTSQRPAGNRNDDGPESLEATIRLHNADSSLPVFTIANLSRFRHERS